MHYTRVPEPKGLFLTLVRKLHALDHNFCTCRLDTPSASQSCILRIDSASSEFADAWDMRWTLCASAAICAVLFLWRYVIPHLYFQGTAREMQCDPELWRWLLHAGILRGGHAKVLDVVSGQILSACTGTSVPIARQSEGGSGAVPILLVSSLERAGVAQRNILIKHIQAAATGSTIIVVAEDGDFDEYMDSVCEAAAILAGNPRVPQRRISAAWVERELNLSGVQVFQRGRLPAAPGKSEDCLEISDVTREPLRNALKKASVTATRQDEGRRHRVVMVGIIRRSPMKRFKFTNTTLPSIAWANSVSSNFIRADPIWDLVGESVSATMNRSWGSVLDAGTGPSSLGFLLRQRCRNLTAVTASRGMVYRLKHIVRPHLVDADQEVTLLLGNWHDLTFRTSFRAATYDVVVCDYVVGAIEHFSPGFQEALLDTLLDLVRPGGVIAYVGLQPFDALGRGSVDKRVLELTRVRDAATILSGRRPYIEFSEAWALRQILRPDYTILASKRFPKYLYPSQLFGQIYWARTEIRTLRKSANLQSLRRALDTYVDRLFPECEHSLCKSTVAPPAAGYDHVIIAQRRLR